MEQSEIGLRGTIRIAECALWVKIFMIRIRAKLFLEVIPFLKRNLALAHALALNKPGGWTSTIGVG